MPGHRLIALIDKRRAIWPGAMQAANELQEMNRLKHHMGRSWERMDSITHQREPGDMQVEERPLYSSVDKAYPCHTQELPRASPSKACKSYQLISIFMCCLTIFHQMSAVCTISCVTTTFFTTAHWIASQLSYCSSNTAVPLKRLLERRPSQYCCMRRVYILHSVHQCTNNANIESEEVELDELVIQHNVIHLL